MFQDGVNRNKRHGCMLIEIGKGEHGVDGGDQRKRYQNTSILFIIAARHKQTDWGPVFCWLPELTL